MSCSTIIFLIVLIAVFGFSGLFKFILVDVAIGVIIAIIIHLFGNSDNNTPNTTPKEDPTSSQDNTSQERRLLAILSAMFAKMAKADGHITKDEIEYCETVFSKLGFTGNKREFCINAFREAKDDNKSIYDYAEELMHYNCSRELRSIIYSMLWDMACADGVLSNDENYILKKIASIFLLGQTSYYREAYKHGAQNSRNKTHQSYENHRSYSSQNTSNDDPYEILGVPRTATNSEIKKAYHSKAKELHPDRLRAQGLPEELLKKANEKMATVNAAWAQIKKERNI